MSVRPIAPEMLRRIMEPQPWASLSLRHSGDAFHKMGRDFDAQLCWQMADDAEGVGDHLYRTWAIDQAERVIAKQGKRA